MSRFLTKVNPIVKCALVLVIAIALSFTYSATLNVWVFAICFALIILGSGKILSALKFLLPTTLVAVGFLITGLYFGGAMAQDGAIGVSSLDTGINLATRIFAFAGLGMIFSLTTDPIDFMNCLHHQLGISRKFTCGLLCAFHLLPYIRNEYENARLAILIRGIKLTPLSIKPIFATLVNSIRWSEALSIAMQSKGFDEN